MTWNFLSSQPHWCHWPCLRRRQRCFQLDGVPIVFIKLLLTFFFPFLFTVKKASGFNVLGECMEFTAEGRSRGKIYSFMPTIIITGKVLWLLYERKEKGKRKNFCWRFSLFCRLSLIVIPFTIVQRVEKKKSLKRLCIKASDNFNLYFNSHLTQPLFHTDNKRKVFFYFLFCCCENVNSCHWKALETKDFY